MHSILEDANTVLLPAFATTTLSDAVKHFLDSGGVSILLGESREEYVARRMSESRRNTETADTIRSVTNEARARSGLLLAAVDQEMGGICRLHGLIPQFPRSQSLSTMSPMEIEQVSFQMAEAASEVGINAFLAPILDVLTGTNIWLNGRTWSNSWEKVTELSAAFIRGVQRGGVAATGKHFPGFSETTGDPAIDPQAVSLASKEIIERGLGPFRSAVAAGVEMMMVGPTSVVAIDPHNAALRSPAIIHKLRVDLGFRGVVMADDLDSKATMRDDGVEKVAIDALNAGCDFLLLADIGSQITDVAHAIAASAADGRISRAALRASAEKIRALCNSYGTTHGSH
jgi:beta-N-acetylhexosaminidase